MGLENLALGFQIHFSLNSAQQYLRVAAAADLPWLMPVFWIGFNVLMFPAAGLATQRGAVGQVAKVDIPHLNGGVASGWRLVRAAGCRLR